MESGAGTAVDPHALWAAAQRLDEAADLLCGALAVHLRPLRWWLTSNCGNGLLKTPPWRYAPPRIVTPTPRRRQRRRCGES
jgi:hypothetical protein